MGGMILPVKLSNDEFIRRINELNKGYIIRGEYINSYTDIEMECELGHMACETIEFIP
jgi:hypothetical protein